MTDRDEIILRKCLDVYARKPSLRYLEIFAERAGASRSYAFDERLWQEVRARFFPNLTVDNLLEYAINCYRGCPEAGYCPPKTGVTPPKETKGGASMAYINFLAREEIPFTANEFSEFHERYEEMLKKEPNPPTQKDWDTANDWYL
jgi:hypothetical protein